jgi:hypothetical protein
MSEYGSESHPTPSATASSVSIPFLVLSAVLIGLGLTGMAYWLVTFEWPYFASVIAVIVGALMLFTRGSGPDRA